ncbi:metallophosphoesterase [Kibdelosporangium philippinense]|uniref:Metallophosphoesterase n=1 Tax=Kibdelosporangium philippinense TaxID=211113 RepID=A0ABS8Z7F8_9PSEU|nr:metallophosphoesterase [Kibdelosporangium philippinense]MCE7002591.1 metallophosphoesterase [Kibdelosporangium philippinense]
MNQLDADIVAHAGDIADGTPSRRKDQAAPLGTVQSRLAKVYITGNHEYFSEAHAWLDHMANLGWEPLHNKHIVVQRGSAKLVIAGVDDATAKASGIDGHGADLTRALDGADPDLPVILLAHQPKQVRQAVDRVDLQISGHTRRPNLALPLPGQDGPRNSERPVSTRIPHPAVHKQRQRLLGPAVPNLRAKRDHRDHTERRRLSERQRNSQSRTTPDR